LVWIGVSRGACAARSSLKVAGTTASASA
jgi:hypothetical protein